MAELSKILLEKKIILWDFDGCFCDSENVHFNAYNKAFKKFGHTINKDEYFNTFTHTGGGIAQEIKNHNVECDPEQIRKDKLKYYKEFIQAGEAKIFQEIPEILRRLYSLGIKNVIASNSSKEEIEIILSHSNEKILIDNIYGLSAGLRKKPHPDIFNHALEKSGFSPSDALIVEDSERGLIAARDANCDAIWVKTYLTEKFSTTIPHLAKISHKDILSLIS
jgi:beta-phosphoglucomutase